MKIFFSGIGGSGVSALASFMADKGHKIVGSDRSFDSDKNHPAMLSLLAKGIEITPQDGSGIDSSFDQIVFSTAVEKDLPEPKRAKELGIPIKMRPAFLAEIVASHQTFAVAGTSGKSTTSGMLAYLMKEIGLAPNFIGGGRVTQFKSTSNLGNAITGDSKILVAEACESDGSIVSYYPEFTLLLNLDLDHQSVEKTAKMFQIIAKQTKRKVLMNADDTELAKIGLLDFASFSIENSSDYRVENLKLQPLSSSFTMRGVEFILNLPGKYNVYNAAACLAALGEFGVALKECVKPLAAFKGIERRFDVYLDNGKSLVVDDFAHNPHKIASMMEMSHAVRPAITYIFQPHGFAPTRMMKNEYIAAFAQSLRANDRLLVLPIYYVGGTVAKDISSEDIAAGVRASGKQAQACLREDILAKVKSGEAYIVFGARDESLGQFASAIAKVMR